MENYNVGVIMRKKREALGYTRRKMCEVCHWEFTEKTLCRLESGRGSVRRESIGALLELYHQQFYTADVLLDLEGSSAGKLYYEIPVLLFQENYQEAQRKLELLERYINKCSKTGRRYLETMKRHLQCSTEGDEMDGEEAIRFFEVLLGDMLPEGADLEKWPMNHIELNIFLIFLNILCLKKQNKQITLISRRLLANIERRYQPGWIFANLHGCFSCKLIRAMHKTGEDDRIQELAEKSIKICKEAGNIPRVYQLQRELLCYWEENDFFQNAGLKEQCFETAKKMYFLSAVCADRGSCSYFKRYLKRVYGYVNIY